MITGKEKLSLYLERILEAIKKIEFHTRNLDVSLLEKHPTEFDACLMQLIHIGEIAGKIAKKFPEFDILPITRMIGLRNFAAHDYLGININIVKLVITKDLPEIQKKIILFNCRTPS